MNILIAAPNDNFDINQMKSFFNNDDTLTNDNLFFEDQQLSQTDLESIDVLVGFNHQLLNNILTDDKSRLKFIQVLSVGIDYLPMDLIKKRNVKLATINGVHQEPIAESVIGMILGQYRQIEKYSKLDQWTVSSFPMEVMADKTAVLFGTGGIGKRVAEILKVLHVHTIGVNTRGHEVPYFDKTVPTNDLDDDVFSASMVINSLPLSASTSNMFNSALFNRFTNQPIFVNVGRGGSVNTDDMVNAIKGHRLGAIAVDVTDPEPLPDDSELWQLDNVYVSPHVSAKYSGFLKNSIKIVDKNIISLKKNGEVTINEVK